MPFGLLEVKLVPVRSCECIFKMQFHLGRYCRFTKLIRPFAASFQKKIQSGLNRVSPPAWVPSGGLLCDQHATARGDTWPGLKQSTSAERIPGRTASSTAVGPGWKEGKQGRGGGGGSAAKPNARLSFHPRFPKLAISHLSHQTSSTGGTKGGRPCPDGMRGSWKGRWVKLRPQKMSHPVRNIKGSDFYPVPVASVDLVLKSIASPPMARSYFKERKLYRKLATRKPKRCLKNMLI